MYARQRIYVIRTSVPYKKNGKPQQPSYTDKRTGNIQVDNNYSKHLNSRGTGRLNNIFFRR